VQAVSRGAARCALHVHGRGPKTDACGRSFAVLSAQAPTVRLRLRLKSWRVAQADARGATPVLGRGVQAVARDAYLSAHA
jgi:hypothetical protein